MPTVEEFVVLNKAQRGPGTFISNSRTVPDNINFLSIRIRGDLDANDLTDSNNKITFWIERFDTERGIWVNARRKTWEGNLNGVPPALTMEAAKFEGQEVRGVLDLSQRLRIGATAEVFKR